MQDGHVSFDYSHIQSLVSCNNGPLLEQYGDFYLALIPPKSFSAARG
jgi:hypothetical protein